MKNLDLLIKFFTFLQENTDVFDPVMISKMGRLKAPFIEDLAKDFLTTQVTRSPRKAQEIHSRGFVPMRDGVDYDSSEQ